ncbi:hypothetical protein DIPPA_09359 [Diplonema papillatum]|nr:hypothetical protein DIPPA_09359 [Diplonema papillatum]|eukprot:gene11342-17439_t
MHRASVVGMSWDAPLPGMGVGSSVDSKKFGSVVDTDRLAGDPDDPSRFYVIANGIVESCVYPGAGNLYCRFKVEAGPDWEVLQLSNASPNVDEGVTQVSERLPGPNPLFAWNLPFSVVFASTNPWGWPKLSVSVYSVEESGVFGSSGGPMGYGWCHVPTKAGTHSCEIPLFAPIASTPMSWLRGLLQGHKYEFCGTSFSKEDNREVTRVRATGGTVHVTFNLLTKGMATMGYR